ncbi:hypothetical protein HA402_008266 [Bradysia odoriphaga]|nr:hypothetical protein HA402_008266 [Bradysia odoriphaga]
MEIWTMEEIVPTLKPLSVHVLDTNLGGNAPNVTCKLYRKVPTLSSNAEEKFNLLATAVTDANGRISQFLSAEDYTPGVYRIWFEIGDYYQHSYGLSTFFPQTQITYENKDGSASHIPLVVSPYAISTYKGS